MTIRTCAPGSSDTVVLFMLTPWSHADHRTPSCAALGMPAFPNLFDDLGAEGLKVTRISRGDHALVDDDFRIFPFCAGIVTSVLIDLYDVTLRPWRCPFRSTAMARDKPPRQSSWHRRCPC